MQAGPVPPQSPAPSKSIKPTGSAASEAPPPPQGQTFLSALPTGVEARAAWIWACLRRNVPCTRGHCEGPALTAGCQQTSPHSQNTSWCTQGAWGGDTGQATEPGSGLGQMSARKCRRGGQNEPVCSSQGTAAWLPPSPGSSSGSGCRNPGHTESLPGSSKAGLSPKKQRPLGSQGRRPREPRGTVPGSLC